MVGCTSDIVGKLGKQSSGRSGLQKIKHACVVIAPDMHILQHGPHSAKELERYEDEDNPNVICVS